MKWARRTSGLVCVGHDDLVGSWLVGCVLDVSGRWDEMRWDDEGKKGRGKVLDLICGGFATMSVSIDVSQTSRVLDHHAA
jgi:hypothetical protein